MSFAFLGSISNVGDVLMCCVSTPLTLRPNWRQENQSRSIFWDDPHFSWREVYGLMRCTIPKFKGDEINGTEGASGADN